MARRMLELKFRGRVRHTDRYGLSYWIWRNNRAMSTRQGQARTDDFGVLEQLKAVYPILNGDQTDGLVSFDVGGYIGVISLAMAHFGSTVDSVHTFEADDINFERLTENIESSSYSQISAYKTAISNYVGNADFTRNVDPGTNHLTESINQSGTSSKIYKVPVTTIDSVAAELGVDRIDILKIDVEGSDINVIRGAKRLLEQEKIRFIISEVPESESVRREMVSELAQYGFKTQFIVRNSDRLIPATDSDYDAADKAPLNMVSALPHLSAALRWNALCCS